MAPAKVHVEVEMCCNKCVDNVEEILYETHGVASFKIERYNSLVIITRKPDTSLDKKQLVRKLQRATHDGKASVIKTTQETANTDTSTNTNNQTPGLIYTGMPYIGPVGLVSWPASTTAGSSGSGVITNPFYFVHPIRCHYCSRYSDIVCANCGRGSSN